ncbi:MAG: valyl-tRNA synthetase, partial [Myxococcota bacterium]
QALVERVTALFEEWNFAQALHETESFFWTHFTDTYLELAKPRARWYEDGVRGEQAVLSGSSVAALRLGFNVLLRLFAPVMPYITEEIWSWTFAEETGEPSIHRAPWPSAVDFEGIAAPDSKQSFALAVGALAAINKSKADNEVSLGREVEKMTLNANAATLALLAPVEADVMAATRCASNQNKEDAQLEDGVVAIAEIVFAPKPEKPAKPSA